MNTEKKMLAAFILNFLFSVFEFFGGIFTGSIAILSDAVHDMGDAVSIGLSFLLERKSKKAPDEKYTLGYGRFSVLGGTITSVILTVGSVFVIINAVKRLFHPSEINYDAMLLLAIVGIAVNLAAAVFTHGGGSLNLHSVNLHMLEDVLGWAVVLLGAAVMKFTDLIILDPLMSLGVSLFILTEAAKNLKECAEVFLMKAPNTANPLIIKKAVLELDGVFEVRRVHVWSLDGEDHCASIHIVCKGNTEEIKKQIREKLNKTGVNCISIETETTKNLGTMQNDIFVVE